MGFGIYSSDITHKADPDTFDINKPVFPYERSAPRVRPQPGPTATPPQLQQISPSPPGRTTAPGNPQPEAVQQLAPAMAFPGAAGPTSIGGPAGPTPLMPPSDSGSPSPAPPQQRTAPSLPPLHFAPVTPQNFGPFTMPAPSSLDASGGPGAAQKPGGLLGMMIDAGLMPWNPNEFASKPVGSPDRLEQWARERPRAPASSPRPFYDLRSFAAPTDGSSDADDPKDIRVLRRLARASDGSLIPFPLPSPNQRQNVDPFDLSSGKLTTDHPLAPIFGLEERTAPSDEGDDFFARWIKPLFKP